MPTGNCRSPQTSRRKRKRRLLHARCPGAGSSGAWSLPGSAASGIWCEFSVCPSGCSVENISSGVRAASAPSASQRSTNWLKLWSGSGHRCPAGKNIFPASVATQRSGHQTAPIGLMEHPDAAILRSQFITKFPAAISGAVIYQKQLPVLVTLRLHALHTVPQIRINIIDRHNDRYKRFSFLQPDPSTLLFSTPLRFL